MESNKIQIYLEKGYFHDQNEQKSNQKLVY